MCCFLCGFYVTVSYHGVCIVEWKRIQSRQNVDNFRFVYQMYYIRRGEYGRYERMSDYVEYNLSYVVCVLLLLRFIYREYLRNYF